MPLCLLRFSFLIGFSKCRPADRLSFFNIYFGISSPSTSRCFTILLLPILFWFLFFRFWFSSSLVTFSSSSRTELVKFMLLGVIVPPSSHFLSVEHSPTCIPTHTIFPFSESELINRFLCECSSHITTTVLFRISRNKNNKTIIIIIMGMLPLIVFFLLLDLSSVSAPYACSKSSH